MPVAIGVPIAIHMAIAIATRMAITDTVPHLTAMDRHLRVGPKAQPNAAPLDLQDRDLEHDLQILRPTDDHTLAILPR
jgi:hypothetical protein